MTTTTFATAPTKQKTAENINYASMAMSIREANTTQLPPMRQKPIAYSVCVCVSLCIHAIFATFGREEEITNISFSDIAERNNFVDLILSLLRCFSLSQFANVWLCIRLIWIVFSPNYSLYTKTHTHTHIQFCQRPMFRSCHLAAGEYWVRCGTVFMLAIFKCNLRARCSRKHIFAIAVTVTRT